jgi:type IV pilus assembly protein PilY1
MKTTSQIAKNIFSSLMMLAIAANTQAAVTDLANAPLVVSTASTLAVQPNVFLMMDDSGSMGWDYMPDTVSSFQNNYGYTSSQCNGIYYDPALTYTPPVTSTGASYANASFTAAWNDGYNTTGGTTNLSTSFSSGGSTTGAAFYYTYSGTQTTLAAKDYYNTASTFYKECNSSIGSLPGSSKFTKVTVSVTSGPGSTDERINFANWYSYYSTRINMMKTATGLAFNPLTNNFRVGFATMNNNGGSKFLNLAAFDATQRTAWYAMLYSTSANNSTPLLGALSDVGLMYANKLSALNGVSVKDPMQYSCQQNFAILSTDGFWNSQTGNSRLDGTAVGQQDGNEIRPMYDGAGQNTQTSTPTTTVVEKQTVQNTTSTTPWTQTSTTVGGNCPAATLPTNCIQGNSSKGTRTWCMEANTSNGSECLGTFGSGTQVYTCRGTGNNSSLPGGTDKPCLTDSGGTKWCLFTNKTSPGTSLCQSNGYDLYVCAASGAGSGKSVTIQNQSYNQLVIGNTTTVTDYTTVVTSTVATINGQTQPATKTTVGPTAAVVSGPTTAATSNTGAPTSTTTWASVSTTSCVVTSLPAGTTTTAPVAGAPTITNNGIAATPTTLSTTTTVGTPVTTTTSTTGGSTNTLADVAEYYYVNDLRTSALGNCVSASGSGQTLCTTASPDTYNNVPSSGLDAASWQHMTTFTLGLGARGKMIFSPSYSRDTSGDFFSVKNGLSANSTATPPVCSWQSNGTTCNWPIPPTNGGDQTTIDDLWHAAVDGRGTYFSADSPATLATGLNNALSGVSARSGASAAATTSNPNVTAGDNFVFSSTFVSQDWYGELVQQLMDLTTGTILPAITWSAQGQLDANASRTIYTYNSGSANGLQAFTATNFGADASFNTPNISSLSQLCTPGGATCLSAAQATSAAGQNLVNYLRGDRANEGVLYRQRAHVLGDIVDAEALYVKSSLMSYADLGYSSFVTANAARQGMVYAAANDGMLHAFYAATDMMDTNGNIVTSGGTSVTGGSEAWAYIPALLRPKLYKLADNNYANQHQYFVDGTPVEGDICTSNCSISTATWKTILVGGLNGGGTGYYALDITNPASPKALWEFTDTNMGYTYGNPVIAKLNDGTWVVLVTSGYNNVSGDGQGHLYVLNANTGALIRDISTGVGVSTTPSGLARINAKVVNPGIDNTITQVYGGDLLGKLWRFDVNGNVGAAGYDAQLLVTLIGPAGVAQPITDKPEVGMVSGNTMVYVGTGRYLGVSDLTDPNQATPNQQSIYAIKDPLAVGTTPATAIYSTVRGGGFVQQILTSTTCPAGSPASICTVGQIVLTSTQNTVNLATANGWYVDLLGNGERATNDPTLQLGTLGFTTNLPSVSACTIGGKSFAYFFNYRTGGPIAGTISGVLLGNALATRPVFVRLPNNSVVDVVRLSTGETKSLNVPIGAGTSGTRRVSWRALFNQ